MIFAGPALMSYVQSHANTDDVVSFAVQLASGGSCPAGVVSAVFDSREDAAGSAPILTMKSPSGGKSYFVRLPFVLRGR